MQHKNIHTRYSNITYDLTVYPQSSTTQCDWLHSFIVSSHGTQVSHSGWCTKYWTGLVEKIQRILQTSKRIIYLHNCNNNERFLKTLCLIIEMFEYLMHYCIPKSSVARRRHFRSARRHYLNTVSARMGVGHLLLPAQLPGTHWVMMCVIWHLAPTVSDVCLQLGCFQSTSTYSALEVLHFMRYINSRLTYLLWMCLC